MVVVLPLLQPPELLRPLEVGQPVMVVVGVCCLEDWDLDWPQRFCPISVRVLELELVGSPQESFEPGASLVVGVERLQVEELSEWLVSAAELVVFSVDVRGAIMALEATLPGVMVGSSVGSFI